jgi:hypothetical protein
MSYWTDLRAPSEQELLIGFYDLTGYICATPKAPSPARCSS